MTTAGDDVARGPTDGRRWRIAAVLSLAVLVAVLLALGWDRGPDALIDFGRELYVPWRLVEGDRLHEDIAWFNGPAGPWTIQAWMGAFGVSADALHALDALVTIGTLALLVVILRSIAGDLAAWAGGVVFAATYAVTQQDAIGNYLFLAPYSHGITFGFAASLVALVALTRALASPSPWPPLTAGVALGAAYLTKAEITLAVFAAAAVVLGLAGYAPGAAGRRRRILTLVVAGALLPVTAAFLRFAAEIGLDRAPRALAGTWPYVFDDRARDLPFYLEMRGTDDTSASLARIATFTGGIALFVGGVLLAVRALATRAGEARVAALLGLGFGGLATIVVLLVAPTEWLLVPLPIVLAALFVRAARRLPDAAGTDAAPAAILEIGFIALAAALLPKILLAAVARRYGFVLTVPGAMLAVAALVHWLPTRLARDRDRSALIALRAAGVGIVLAFVVANVHTTVRRYRAKDFAIGEGPDRILAMGWRGAVLSALEKEAQRRLEPGETLLVLPEGIVVNYHLRVRSPSRVVNFMPPELVFFDESEIVAELDAAPPALVVIVHRRMDEYGQPFFGDGFGAELLAWVRERYERDQLIGDEPLKGGPRQFGAELLVPRSPR